MPCLYTLSDSCFPSYHPVHGGNPFAGAVKWRYAFNATSHRPPLVLSFQSCRFFSPWIHKPISMTTAKLSSAAPFLLFRTLLMLQSHLQPFLCMIIWDLDCVQPLRCLCGWSIRSQQGAMSRSLISLPVRFQAPVCLPPAILKSTDGQSISIDCTVAKCGLAAILVFRDESLNLYLKSRWSAFDPRPLSLNFPETSSAWLFLWYLWCCIIISAAHLSLCRFIPAD